jgi:hypothetical protein
MQRLTTLCALVAFASVATAEEQSKNPALVVLDLACVHLVGGGTCDSFKLSAETQASVEKAEHLQHTNTPQLCLAASAALTKHKGDQGTKGNKEYCDELFDYNGEAYM